MATRLLLFAGLIWAAVHLGACGRQAASQARAEQNTETAKAKPSVRRPAVAGAFYPADPDQLREFVGKALKQAQPPQLQGRIVALVSPHAGYEFSGAVAAYAYKVLEGKKIDTVVVVGPSHHSGFAGALLTESDAWETPLGPVEIDHTTVAALEKAAPGTFRRDDALQAMEHSVEIQLPFLQTVLENFKFVPVLIHDFSPDNCRTIGHAIAEAVRGRDFVLVASTDLAHYPPRELCRQVDLKTLSNIEQWDIDAIYRWERQATDQYADKEVHCTMCGLGPVVAVLAAARELGADKVARLKYANSGEIDWRTADRSVGYGALAIVDTDVPQHGEAQSGQRPSGRAKAVTKQIGADRPAGGGKGMEKSSPLGTTDNLNDVQKKQLLALARKAITEWVTNRRCVKPNLSDPAFRPERAVFVTLRKHGLLRGCIGTLEPVAPLAEAVVDSAISAATEDPRFPPVRPEELSEIDIHISVLSPLRRIDRPDEIILGKHGIVVQQGLRRGVFLPEVAPEQGWDLETTLSILCVEKAGLPADAWKRGAELYVFTTQSFGEEDFNKRAAGG